MLVKSFAFPAIALVTALFTYFFLITIPACFIFTVIVLSYAIRYVIEHREKKDIILSSIAIIFNLVVMIILFFFMIAVYQLIFIENIALISF